MAVAGARGAGGRTTREHHLSPLATWGVVAIAGIWVPVLVISLFSPDMVTGSEQDHTPIAAILTWIWGLVATRSVLVTLAAQRGRPDAIDDVRLLVVGIVALWVVAALVAVFAPVVVTGSDPTKMPFGAIFAPIAAMVVSTTACQLFSSWHAPREQAPTSGPAAPG